jgi:hypothetical protein
MATDVIDQLREYLDYAGTSAGETLVTKPDPASSPVRWYRRGPVLAGIAALAVLISAVPAVLLAPNTVPPADEQLPAPLDVGIELVWPASGFGGDADEVAAEFARLALGWTDSEIVSDPDAAADGPVWTTIKHPGREDLEVLSIPVGDGRRALIQVGTPGVTTGPGEDGDGQQVGFPRVAGTTSAVLHVRFVDSDRVEVMRAELSDLERGRVSVASESPVGGVVVVYVDEDGEAVTARGGHFGPVGTGVIEVPASHAAHGLLADGYPADGSPQHGALCAESDWRICLVLDGGILVVVAFGNPDGTAVTLEGPAVPEGPITLPAAGHTVFGIESPGRSITATVLVAGEWAGELNGTLTEASGPGSSTVLADVSDEEIETAAGTWVNQLGLVQTDPGVWRDRLIDACTAGVWNPDVAFELADRYLAEDSAIFAAGDDATLPATAEATDALWTMTAQVCRDSFPAGAIDAGPP